MIWTPEESLDDTETLETWDAILINWNEIKLSYRGPPKWIPEEPLE